MVLGINGLKSNLRSYPPGQGFVSESDTLPSHLELLPLSSRLVFGTTAMYVFYHPAEAAASGQQYADVTHEMAQEEIAANSGFDMNTENKSRGEMRQDKIV